MSFTHQIIDINDRVKFDEFVDSLFTKFPFNDVFETVKKINLAKHTHSGIESRLFLEGTAKFLFDGKQIVDCVPGSYIEIDSETPHSFKYSGKEPLKVLRFFSNHAEWTGNFCDHQ